MPRDFKAEAIARRKEDQALAKAAAPYQVKANGYAFRIKPAGMPDHEWRHDCEVKWILDGLPNQQQRQAYLAKVEQQRGQQARTKLEQDVMALWQSRKQ